MTLVVPTVTPAFLDARAEEVHRLSRVEQVLWLSYQGSAVDAVDMGRDCVRMAQSESERRRMQATYRRRAIISDNWQQLVYADLRKRLRPELHAYVMGPSGEYCDISRNPAKNIWAETAVLYKAAAQRETPEDPEDSERYRRLVRGTQFNTFWASVEFELMCFNDLVIWPTVVKRRGRSTLRHNKAAGDTVVAIHDPELGDSEPWALVFIDTWLDGGRWRERYVWWTAKWRAVYDDERELNRLDPVNLQPIDDDAPILNPYGEMIFTYLHVNPYHPTFWDQTSGDDLVELTLKTGRQQTQTADLFNRSGHKQLVSHGNGVRNKSDKTLLDPGAHIKIDGEGSTFIVDWSIDFEARQRCIDNDEARAAGTYGINPERLRKTSYQTAEGARLTERPLEERRAKMREPMADAERSYREAVIRVAARDNLVDAAELPNPDVWMEVLHAPIAYPGDPKAQLEVDAAEVALGVTNAIELMQRRYPGISREEAKNRLEDNLKAQAEIAAIKQKFNVPADPRNRSAEDEQNGRTGPVIRDGQDDNGKPPPGSPPGQQAA